MKIAVTGAAGFMGSWLANELQNRGHVVVPIDDFSGSMYDPQEVHHADCRNLMRMTNLFKGCDMVFHLAAYAAEGQSVFSPIAINDINIRGMNTVLVAAVNNAVKRVIFTSSMAVYGNQKPPFIETMQLKPVDPYGAGKAYCEQMLKIFHDTHGLDYTIIRPHNVFGPGQNISDPYRNVIGIWMNRILRGKPPIIYGDGKQKRAFSYIEDFTPALANSINDSAKNQIINVGGKAAYTINEAASLVCKVAGTKPEPVHEPDRLGEVKNAWCTWKKSEKLLDYKDSTSFRKNLQKMWEWAEKTGAIEPTWKLPLEIEHGAPEMWRKQAM